MNDPLVSIIIPTYNREKYITSTITSILNQSYNNLELIVVDDGSKDSTKEIIQEIIANNLSKKIKYIYQANKGAPSARNSGFKLSKGEYIVFFDSDDLMLIERIEKQVKRIHNTKFDCCVCGFESDDSKSKYIPPKFVQNPLMDFFRLKLYGSTQCWLFKREVIEKVNGYDEELTCFQDIDLVFRILTCNIAVCTVCEVLTMFNNSDNNRVSNYGKTLKGLNSYIISHIKRIEFIRENFNFTLARIELKEFLSLITNCYRLNSFEYKKIINEAPIQMVGKQNMASKITFQLLKFYYIVFYNLKGYIKYRMVQ